MNNLSAREFYTIVGGSVLLSFNAGYINVVSMAGVFSITVTHVTGNISKIATSSYKEDYHNLALVSSIVISYCFGAFISGYLLGDVKFKLGTNYGYALFLESGFLFLSYIFLQDDLILGEWCAAFAMGLQNAMCTSFSGLVVRTTHMTGIVTDIGNILGQSCRRDTKAELWRLKVHIPLLIGFCVGGIFGQFFWGLLKLEAMLLPTFFAGGTALLYLSLPWVKEAVREAEVIAKQINFADIPLLNIRDQYTTQNGEINARRDNYQEQLKNEMNTFLADIEKDQLDNQVEGERNSLKRNSVRFTEQI